MLAGIRVLDLTTANGTRYLSTQTFATGAAHHVYTRFLPNATEGEAHGAL